MHFCFHAIVQLHEKRSIVRTDRYCVDIIALNIIGFADETLKGYAVFATLPPEESRCYIKSFDDIFCFLVYLSELLI